MLLQENWIQFFFIRNYLAEFLTEFGTNQKSKQTKQIVKFCRRVRSIRQQSTQWRQHHIFFSMRFPWKWRLIEWSIVHKKLDSWEHLSPWDTQKKTNENDGNNSWRTAQLNINKQASYLLISSSNINTLQKLKIYAWWNDLAQFSKICHIFGKLKWLLQQHQQTSI